MRKTVYTKANGRQITNKGYVRITRGPHKWTLLHRRVMEIMLEATHPLTLACLGVALDNRGKCHTRSIPDKYDIHHVDANKTHDCPQNLMLLERVIHARLFINK